MQVRTSTGRDPFSVEATMKDARKKTAPEPPQADDDQPDPIEGRPDDVADEYPRRNTEQAREKKPGTMTREEIRARTHRNKE
jgi:hypothetical protein